jgi:hypothetical protein
MGVWNAWLVFSTVRGTRFGELAKCASNDAIAEASPPTTAARGLFTTAMCTRSLARLAALNAATTF